MSVSFGDSIRRGREAVGLSQARVAQLIGRSPSTIRSWELGRTHPGDSSAVTAIAAVLGLDEDDLLGRAGFEAAPIERPRLDTELRSLRQLEVPVLVNEFASDALRLPGGPRHLGGEPAPAAQMDSLADVDGQAPREIWASRLKAASLQVEGWGQEVEKWIRGFRSRPPKPKQPKPVRNPRTTSSPPELARPGRSQQTSTAAYPATLAKSYLENEEERDFYRRRAAATTVVVALLFVIFWWALRNTGGAIGDFVGGIVDQLDFS